MPKMRLFLKKKIGYIFFNMLIDVQNFADPVLCVILFSHSKYFSVANIMIHDIDTNDSQQKWSNDRSTLLDLDTGDMKKGQNQSGWRECKE